jgi:hypothetical protein
MAGDQQTSHVAFSFDLHRRHEAEAKFFWLTIRRHSTSFDVGFDRQNVPVQCYPYRDRGRRPVPVIDVTDMTALTTMVPQRKDSAGSVVPTDISRAGNR